MTPLFSLGQSPRRSRMLFQVLWYSIPLLVFLSVSFSIYQGSKALQLAGTTTSRSSLQDKPFLHPQLGTRASGKIHNKQDAPRVIIVSADNRRPRVANTSLEELEFYEWAALANLAYAQRQGYGYVYHVFEHKNCTHPRYGSRSIAWCKLLAIQKALETLPREQETPTTILWMDSDAAWVHQATSVDSFLNATALGCNPQHYDDDSPPPKGGTPPGYGCQTEKCQKLRDSSDMLCFSNRPICHEACMTGTFLLKANRRGRAILSWWWNLNLCANRFPWEQRAANLALFPNLYGEGGGVEVLSTSHNYFPGPGDVARHYGHTNRRSDGTSRKNLMRQAFESVGLKDDVQRLSNQLSKHIEVLSLREVERLGQDLADLSWNQQTDMADRSWSSRRNVTLGHSNKRGKRLHECPKIRFYRPRYRPKPGNHT